MDEKTKNYIIGIDLGTSNSALAFTTNQCEEIQQLAIEQIESPGHTLVRQTLPSVIYVPLEGEISVEEVRLPWESTGQDSAVLGTWARERGTLVADRFISSAKSWLANGHVDRHEAILPWKSCLPSGKLSPVEVSQKILQHLRGALHHTLLQDGKSIATSECQTVVTVPASFDEVARNLTYEAAQSSGLGSVTLLEEPLAAFYAWIAKSSEQWRTYVSPGDLVLVCDIGGGTSDFSLVSVGERGQELVLERISVGEHLLLGGDNMDLALAHFLKQQLQNESVELDHWQFMSLVNGVRSAKERLLESDELDQVPVSVASRGSSLFAKTISTSLTREAVEKVILEGFFPASGADQMPSRRATSAFQEFGLRYETEAAVSRHLVRFLARSKQNVESNEELRSLLGDQVAQSAHGLMPTAVLFNGGVFKAPVIRERILALLNQWSAGANVRELPSQDFDLAVAYGAAYYAKSKASGKGVRIRSGTARSYYIGIETPMPAVPGLTPPVKGLCLVPQGTEEGSEILIENEQFGLLVGEPAEFRFFSSAVRAGDCAGAMVDDANVELEESARLSILLPSEEGNEGEMVPVKLDAVVTEVGTLRLYMKHTQTDRKWNLEFNVRPQDHT